MRHLLLLLSIYSIYGSEILINNQEIQIFVDKYNALQKETEPKTNITESLKITHPDSAMKMMLTRMLENLDKPLPPNVTNLKYGNKPKIIKFEILKTEKDKSVVLTEDEGGKTIIYILKRDKSDNGLIKMFNNVQY